MLRTIRDVKKYTIKSHKLEALFQERTFLEKKLQKLMHILHSRKQRRMREIYRTKISKIKSSELLAYKNLRSKYFELDGSEYISNRIFKITQKINRTLFLPEYVTVVMEHETHYRRMFLHGFKINGRTYKRFSCSAGQARCSTVVFIPEDIIDEVRHILNNGRDLSVKMTPSKFNAYFGLYGSATKIVSTPKFIVVKDFINTTSFMSNYITESDWDKDDIVEDKLIENMEMNRTDGMGLISPSQSKKWADELGLDWIPAQWCVRPSFGKGMLNTFEIHEFCEEVNNGNYIVNTIYQDSDGEYIKADLRDYDVIITESQFKLWDSYKNVDEYIIGCEKNNLYWGVCLYSPKEDNNVLKLNYQFLQTLDITSDKVEVLCSQFVNWINGVSYENFAYMLLFLLGVNNTADKIQSFLRNSENYWLKCLVCYPDLKNDKYILNKIKKLIKKKIQDGCMGCIYVDGNFQVLVYDPYAFMQHVCGHKVTGLLGEGEYYSNYWNERCVSLVNGMRSPLTYRSEHVILNLVKNELTEKWYKYCKSGIILNYHGHEVVNFGGADVDFDILATTSNKVIIDSVYENEYPVVYEPPKSQKILFTEEDLYNADIFSFGSIIGSITNKSSNAYALLSELEDTYGIDSDEHKLVLSRLKQCCKAQSAQIDKAKIGRKVKGIPSVWTNKQRVDIDDETGEVLESEESLNKKKLYNNALLNKHPYFFKYRYPADRKKYTKYIDEIEVACRQNFKIPFNTLLSLEDKNDKQKEFISNYYKYMPLLQSNSPMNLICKYVESVKYNINEKIKSSESADIYAIYKADLEVDSKSEQKIKDIIDKYMQNKNISMSLNENNETDFTEMRINNEALLDRLLAVCKNPYIVTNCAIDYFYVDNPSKNKDILWSVFGKYIYFNVKSKIESIVLFPLPDNKGDVEYMGKKYKMQEVEI